MRIRSLSSFILLFWLISGCKSPEGLNIYVTTDLHGMLLPYDNTEGVATDRSLANLASVVETGSEESMILLDNGDILQGDPLMYYYNFVDTMRTHIVADILNHLGYDAATAGNHDIETGHPVYDRVRRQYNFPLLAANAIDTVTGEPYFEPYTVIRKGGLKVVVFGLITPSVPDWLPEALYSGIRFDGMVETAQKWMPEMVKEKPDIIVGLFHSGMGDEDETGEDENSSLAVAVNVPGFDIIFCGHDHNQEVKKAVNTEGDTVLMLDGGSRAAVLMHAKISLTRMEDGTTGRDIEGKLIQMNSLPASVSFIDRYRGVSDTIEAYASQIIGRSDASVTTRDAFFGPSAFVDLIHNIQLDISGADISFAAPLSFDEQISEGDLRIRDMFRLYRFENFLYTISMTGSEVDRYLEHSYGLWFNTMKYGNDFMLRYSLNGEEKPVMINGRPRLRNPSYNFDSAMGISYVVDVTKPQGARVTITSMSDGTVFSRDSTYTVAVNSYRANGGGGHIGAAGISQGELDDRLISSTPRDLRFYMTEWIRERGEISPEPLSDWTLIPGKWTSAAADREMKMLFRQTEQ
ncbi:MAG: 5'-nucleotidase C-terminal domain-containing protein [Bacteroidales bacterium]|nr:5'-nucleotidase C-terminal domain-containing protein [Bacteroidales bacterium]